MSASLPINDFLPASLMSEVRPKQDSHKTKHLNHLFIEGEWARELWSFLRPILDLPEVLSMAQLYDRWVVPILISCGLWELWRKRNMMKFDDNPEDINVLANTKAWLHRLLYAFKPEYNISFMDRLTLQAFHVTPRICKQRGRWIAWRSSKGITLNIDGSARGGFHTGGGVLRDENGRWIVGFTAYYGQGTNTLAELKALRDGLIIAHTRGYQIKQVQMDAQVVINMILDMCEIPWQCIYMVRQCRALLEANTTIHHVYREANKVADRLAANAYELQNMQTMEINNLPREVKEAYMEDLYGVPT